MKMSKDDFDLIDEVFGAAFEKLVALYPTKDVSPSVVQIINGCISEARAKSGRRVKSHYESM